MVHVAQAARRLTRGGTTRIRSHVSEGWRFYSLLRVKTGPVVYSASYKMNTGCFPRRQRRPSVGIATLPLPIAMAEYIWTLASIPSVGLHEL